MTIVPIELKLKRERGELLLSGNAPGRADRMTYPDTTQEPTRRVPSMKLPVIVIVDNNEAAMESLRRVFRRSGYSTYAFSDAASALEFISRVPADLVISALRMVGTSGLEFLNQVSSVNPNALRFLLSNREDKDIVMIAQTRELVHHFILTPWNDVLIRELVRGALDRRRSARREHLEEMVGTMEALPSPPCFHVGLQAELARDGSSVKDIAREIEKSPPIVAKLLRVANSVYFARRKAVVTISDAVFFIGTGYISGLVTAIEAFHGFALKTRPEFSAHVEKLWTESFRRGTLAKRIAEKWPGFDAPETVYIASLLQDIGYAVVLCLDPARYSEYVKCCEGGSLTPHEAELKLFDYMHDTLGAALLESWSLPSAIVSAVEKHHQRTEGDAFLQILQIADSLSPGSHSTVHDPAIDDLIVPWREKVITDSQAQEKV
jgi:HD-like signal output (HDOD) protein/CheY-like chemotaxis protein